VILDGLRFVQHNSMEHEPMQYAPVFSVLFLPPVDLLLSGLAIDRGFIFGVRFQYLVVGRQNNIVGCEDLFSKVGVDPSARGVPQHHQAVVGMQVYLLGPLREKGWRGDEQSCPAWSMFAGMSKVAGSKSVMSHYALFTRELLTR
jgi:hypothetical protein